MIRKAITAEHLRVSLENNDSSINQGQVAKTRLAAASGLMDSVTEHNLCLLKGDDRLMVAVINR